MSKVLYFTHDFNARNDPKLVDLMQEHGLAGIGAYWCIVEMLYEYDGTFVLQKLYKRLAFQLRTDEKMIESVLNDFGLFENDGEKIWSNSVNVRLGKAKAISAKRKEAIAKRWKSSQKEQTENNGNTNVLQADTNDIQVDTNKKVKSKNKKVISSTIVEDREGKSAQRFVPPTLEEVKQFILEKQYHVDAEKFWNFYESKGWYVGKNKMKKWRAAVANWEKTDRKTPGGSAPTQRQQIEQQTKSCNDEWI